MTITPSGGCSAVANVGTCPIAGATNFQISLGDLNDSAVVEPTVTDPVTFVLLIGGLGDVVLTGTPSVTNQLNGDDSGPAGGNDTLTGGAATDYLIGEAGNDTLNGGDGGDQIVDGQGDDTGSDVENVEGGLGDDVIVGSAASDTLTGREGDDRIEGGKGSDLIQGQDGDDVLRGGPGNDWIQGGNGSDTQNGEAGDDTLGSQIFDSARDLLSGWPGSDSLDSEGFEAAVKITLDGKADDGARDPTISGPRDRFLGDIESVVGSERYDILVGSSGDQEFHGLGGADRITGEGGADGIFGDSGADLLTGGGGRDLIDGGSGNDRFNAVDHHGDELRCGAGTDRGNADHADRRGPDCDGVRTVKRKRGGK